MLKLHHLSVLSGRGKRKMDVFYHVWLVFKEGLPHLAENMTPKCHRWEFGVPCVKIPAPMSNHGHAATARKPFNGRFIWKKRDFLVASCARELKSRYWRRSFLAPFKVCGYTSTVHHLGLEYLVLFKKVAAFHGQHLFFFMFASNIIQFDSPQRLVLLVPSKTDQPAKGYRASTLGVFGESPTRFITGCERMRGEAKGIDVHLLMMECYQRLGWKKQDLYPGCCSGCCWRPKHQILPQLKLMLKER